MSVRPRGGPSTGSHQPGRPACALAAAGRLPQAACSGVFSVALRLFGVLQPLNFAVVLTALMLDCENKSHCAMRSRLAFVVVVRSPGSQETVFLPNRWSPTSLWAARPSPPVSGSLGG